MMAFSHETICLEFRLTSITDSQVLLHYAKVKAVSSNCRTRSLTQTHLPAYPRFVKVVLCDDILAHLDRTPFNYCILYLKSYIICNMYYVQYNIHMFGCMHNAYCIHYYLYYTVYTSGIKYY